VDPVIVQAEPGDTVVFENETETPQILESDDLRDSNEKLLYTPAIFPKTSYEVTLTSRPQEGTGPEYTYRSITDPMINGSIIILPPSIGEAQSVSSTRASGPFGPLTGVPLPTGGEIDNIPSARSSAASSAAPEPVSEPEPQAASSSSIPGILVAQNTDSDITPAPSGNTGGIPVNPYSTGAVPTDSGIDPMTGTNLHPGPQPNQQPNTGPEVWIVLTLSIGAMLVAQRWMGRGRIRASC
jgi:hypothetical protein